MARTPFQTFINKWSRKLHRWGAILTAIPVVIIIATGLILQWKKEVAWIQPPSAKGSAPGGMSISFDRILDAVRTVPEAEVESWADVDRLDVRPDKGMVKVRCNNRWEVQVDTSTGDVLQVMYRRSDLLEQIHDGSWFHAIAKHWLFFPSALVLLFLWISGLYLWILPIWSKRQGRVRRYKQPRPEIMDNT